MACRSAMLRERAPQLFKSGTRPFFNQRQTTSSVSRCLRRFALQTSHDHLQQPHLLQPIRGYLDKAAQVTGVVLLGSLWVLGRSAAPAKASIMRPSPPLETVVTIAPTAGATAASVPHESDSCAVLVGVCLGFWMLSATISAGIGAIMRLTGRSMAYAGGGGSSAGWTSAGVMDTLDIMRLPLAYDEAPVGSNTPGATPRRENVTYVPWEGPDTYIPVSMVKVFQPGLLEAGRVTRPSLLQADASALSIVSVTRPADAELASRLPTNGNGSNGSKNGKSSSNGKDASDEKQPDSKE